MNNHVINWTDFCDKVDVFLSKKAFSFASFSQCIEVVDPEALQTWNPLFRYMGKMGLFLLRPIRKFCLTSLFSDIQARNKEAILQAPEFAKEMYKALFHACFDDSFVFPQKQNPIPHSENLPQVETAQSRAISLSRDVDLVMKKVSKFSNLAMQCQKIKSQIVSVYRGPENTIHATAEQIRRDLQQVEESYQECTKTLGNIEQRKNNCRKFAQEFQSKQQLSGSVQQTQDRGFTKQLLLELEKVSEFSDIPETFSTEKEYQEYIQTQVALVLLVENAQSAAKLSKEIEITLRQFEKECEKVSPFVKEAFVAPIASCVYEYLTKSSLSTLEISSHLLKKIRDQKQHVLTLDQDIERLTVDQKKKSIPFYEKVTTPELSLYRDLPKKIELLLKPDFSKIDLQPGFIDEETLIQVRESVRRELNQKLGEIEAIIQEGYKRNALLDEMADSVKDVQKVLFPLSKYRDFNEEYAEYKKKLESLLITRKDISRIDSHALGDVIAEHHHELITLKNSILLTAGDIAEKIVHAEKRVHFSKIRLKRRLCEIFSEISLYPDLKDATIAAKKMLEKSIENLDHIFFHREITSFEYETRCNELAYDHDIILLRNELTFRATRLKELREEIRRLIFEVQELRRYYDLIEEGISKELYHDIHAALNALCRLYQEIQNPFKSFSSCVEHEHINHKFRSFWLQVEGLQPQVQLLKEKCNHIFPSHFTLLSKKFLKVIDELEEVERHAVGTRPDLVSHSEQILRNLKEVGFWNGFTAHMREIEKKYRYIYPFSFFLSVQDQRVRQKFLREAKKLSEKAQSLMHFAKTLQTIKTFEEEHIDDILEAFEMQGMIFERNNSEEEVIAAWDGYIQRIQHAIRLVEEEVLLDVGLMDRKGIMDVFEDKLATILEYALHKARRMIERPHSGILSLVEIEEHRLDSDTDTSRYELLSKHIIDLKEKLHAWLAIDSSQKTRALFRKEHLEKFCEILFNCRCLFAARHDDVIAKSYVLQSLLFSFVSLIEKWLEEIRENKDAKLSKPWILECQMLRQRIEQFSFDPSVMNTFSAFTSSIFSDASSIGEIKYEMEHNTLPLNIIGNKAEIDAYVQQIGKTVLEHRTERPFFYIPGYLAYFTSR